MIHKRLVLWLQLPLALVCAGAAQAGATWLSSLPDAVREELLWTADYEAGDLRDWQRPQGRYPGAGVFNTGGADVSAVATNLTSHSGDWAVETTITNANQALDGNRAVRLMAWTDRPWDQGGGYLPDEAYFSTWMMFPHVYHPEKAASFDPGDGGWWNVFQFKSDDVDQQSQPVWTLNVGSDGDEMFFYLYSPVNSPSSYGQAEPRAFGAGQWVHVEAFYRSAVAGQGQVTIYQDGFPILDLHDVTTSLGGADGLDTHPIWGIGNYTDHIDGDPRGAGRATIFFDDAAISGVPLHDFSVATADCNGDGIVDGDDLSCACAVGGIDRSLAPWGGALGDLDADGRVLFADFLILSSNFGAAVDGYLDGDLDCDGSVTFADFVVLADNFGRSTLDSAASVPEPSAVCLLLGAIAVFTTFRIRTSL
jgi:hypothetical protein